MNLFKTLAMVALLGMLQAHLGATPTTQPKEGVTVMYVTNLPCLLSFIYRENAVDSTVKTNAVFDCCVSITNNINNNQAYYVCDHPGLSQLNFIIWSASKDKKPDKQLFPVPFSFDGSWGSTNNPEDYRICLKRPYSCKVICPQELLINAENGLVASTRILLYENFKIYTNNNGDLITEKKPDSILKTQTIYSKPFVIPLESNSYYLKP